MRDSGRQAGGEFGTRRRVARFGATAVAAVALGFGSVAPVSAVVTEITLGDFDNPVVLDFESAALGNVSGTDGLFTNSGLGIVEVTAIGASTFLDAYESRANSSRALWADASGLRVVDPLAGSLANVIAYGIEFDRAHTRVGVGVHDQGGEFTYDLLRNDVLVGSIDITTGTADLTQRYLSSTVAFDELQVSISGGGFAIDNITVESVTEPGLVGLLGLGLAGIGLAGRRRRTAAA